MHLYQLPDDAPLRIRSARWASPSLASELQAALDAGEHRHLDRTGHRHRPVLHPSELIDFVQTWTAEGIRGPLDGCVLLILQCALRLEGPTAACSPSHCCEPMTAARHRHFWRSLNHCSSVIPEARPKKLNPSPCPPSMHPRVPNMTMCSYISTI